MKYELLADVAQVIMGQSPPSSTYNAVGEGLPFYQGKTDFGDMYPTPRIYCTEPSRIAEAGDILISVRAPVGPTNVSQERSCIGRGISAIRVSKNLDRDFLLYFLRFYEPELAKAGTGSTFTAISREDLETIKIPLPPLTEQKRIASLLARADRLRQLRRTAHDLGDALLQSVFLEMFGDLTVNQKNWDLFFLEDIADVHGGIQVTSTRNSMKLQKPYLRVANVYRNQLDLSEIKMIGLTQSEFERTKLQKNDLLFVEGHGNINEIGRAAVWDGSIEDCVHQNHLICARLDLKLANPIFVSTYVNSPAGKSYFTNISNTTSGLNTISTNTVRSCPIPLPPLSLQEEFAGVVARVESLRGRMGESTRQVEGLFESLLSESFGGG